MAKQQQLRFGRAIDRKVPVDRYKRRWPPLKRSRKQVIRAHARGWPRRRR